MRKFFIGRTIGFIVVVAVFIIGYFVLDFFKNEEVVEKVISSTKTIIGQSVEKRNIEAYTFGDGKKHLLFVGGIHGGYEWNSVLLAYQLIDYLETNKEIIPKGITITVIPSANPDGIFEVTNKNGRFYLSDVSSGDQSLVRFNTNGVDLNRNFDCKWQPESTWRGNTVSAGTSAFSEPEAQAIRDFVLENKPVMVAFFHSQSNAVYASECENGILPETLNIMNIYSDASGYPAIDTFDAYEITGDAEGWLASINIPAITVELSTHETIEWDKNLAGIKALFEYYNK
ncbi:MAG: M14 family metallopeptidase [Candidatus Pacebacteria bacterium]|nr:M14 family metallopeptidase [Candidatus Paceibacterota bacterium]